MEFSSCLVCFFSIFQANRSKRYVSAMDEKEDVPTLSRVWKNIVQGGNVYFKTEIEQY